jgi:glycosyltransferase involved in cell wall biosynthesis
LRVTFIIPAYNEAATIGHVLAGVDALSLDKEVIVIDDGSTDRTAEIVEQSLSTKDGCRLIRQANAGKGAAVRAATPHITGDVVVIQDADMEYDPAEVPRLIKPILDGVADVVYGSRLKGGRPQRAHLFWHMVGNRWLSLLTGMLYNTTLSDMETGYKAFRVGVFKALELTEDSFGIEPEITAQICKRNLRIYELPISYYGRTFEEGKKIRWTDGLVAVRVLLEQRVRR